LKKGYRKEIYKKLITLMYEKKAGHIGSCLSCLDILIELFLFNLKKEDRFLLSKGHAVPDLYVILNYLGKISDKDLLTFHTNSTKLPAHVPPRFNEQIPFPSGSLGHGLSLSCGIAQGIKFKSKNKKKIPKVYCLISDGECNEGQVWEGAQYASAKKINNLVILVDNNRLQAFGKTADVLGRSTTIEKWKAFGFNVIECDGTSPKDIKKALLKSNRNSKKPIVIIFKTIKGNGVSFMENKIEWHYKTLDEELYLKAIASIEKNIN